MYPYEPEEAEGAVLECEGRCLDEGIETTWVAVGYSEPDEDGFVFIVGDEDDAKCPVCGCVDEYDVLRSGYVDSL